MSDKEAIEGMKALGELMGILKESHAKLGKIVDIMDKSSSGEDFSQYFVALEKISECSEDDLIAMLTVAVSLISRIRVKTKMDNRYEDLRDLLGVKPAESEALDK